MFSRPIKEINAEFAAEERYLDSIQRIARESCIAGGLSRRNTTAVLLAIEEGATNIIRHAYLYEKGTLRLRIVIYKKLIAFSLIDTGRSFHPQQSGKIDLERLVDSGRKGGLGFYMIQKIMDSVEYISAAGLNELRMIKRIKSSQGHIGEPSRFFTLRAKFSLITFFIVVAMGGTIFWFVDNGAREQVQRHLEETVTALAGTIADQTAGYMINSRSDVEFDELAVSYVRSNKILTSVVISDTAGIIRAHSTDISTIRKPYVYPPTIDPESASVHQTLPGTGSVLKYLMVPINSGDRRLGQVHLIYATDILDDKIAVARRDFVLVSAVLLLAGILCIYLLSNYFVKPIARITHRVRRFTSGDLESELPLEGADEFFEISRALNDMMTRLSRDRKNVIERERMAKEIEDASQIQKTLFPHTLPPIPGLELDAYYRAALVVGGDLYDVFNIGDGRFCLVVADVSGKGVPASLVMSMLRTVIRIHAVGAKTVSETLELVNDYLSDNMPPGMFITVMMAFYDSTKKSLSLVSAGHNPLLLYRLAGEQVVSVNPRGMPLGLPALADRTFAESLKEETLLLRPGDVILIYTDGITEATDREGNQYGLTRLSEFMKETLTADRSVDVSTFVGQIVEKVDSFSGFAKQDDDMTFLVARVDTEDSAQPAAEKALAVDSKLLGESKDSPDSAEDNN
ncbi:MAG: SpoIIE family protein phosphatase [candidate division Zixibacteria bacterium]